MATKKVTEVVNVMPPSSEVSLRTLIGVKTTTSLLFTKADVAGTFPLNARIVIKSLGELQKLHHFIGVHIQEIEKALEEPETEDENDKSD